MAQETSPVEIEITLEMVEAGLVFLKDCGLISLAPATTYPWFVADFLRSTLSVANVVSREGQGTTP